MLTTCAAASAAKFFAYRSQSRVPSVTPIIVVRLVSIETNSDNNAVTLSGQVDVPSGAPLLAVGFCWSTTNTDPQVPVLGDDGFWAAFEPPAATSVPFSYTTFYAGELLPPGTPVDTPLNVRAFAALDPFHVAYSAGSSQLTVQDNFDMSIYTISPAGVATANCNMATYYLTQVGYCWGVGDRPSIEGDNMFSVPFPAPGDPYDPATPFAVTVDGSIPRGTWNVRMYAICSDDSVHYSSNTRAVVVP